MNTMPGYSAIANNVNIYLQTSKKITSAYGITFDKALPFSQDGERVCITLDSVDGYALTELKYKEV
jgi:hypothetical protein